MEDKICLYENTEIFTSSFLSNSCLDQGDSNEDDSKPRRKNAIFGVFDGHCGVDCAQYVSSHLPMTIVQNSDLKNSLESPSNPNLETLIKESFQKVNENFTKKAREEVYIKKNCIT